MDFYQKCINNLEDISSFNCLLHGSLVLDSLMVVSPTLGN